MEGTLTLRGPSAEERKAVRPSVSRGDGTCPLLQQRTQEERAHGSHARRSAAAALPDALFHIG